MDGFTVPPNQRSNPRYKVSKDARLIYPDERGSVEVLIKEISVGGARVKLKASTDLSGTFNLFIPSREATLHRRRAVDERGSGGSSIRQRTQGCDFEDRHLGRPWWLGYKRLIQFHIENPQAITIYPCVHRFVVVVGARQMSKFLTPESVATRPNATYFSSEKLEKLKRIFDAVCTEENVTSEELRDYIAKNLLEAATFTIDERTLADVMKYDIAGYGK